jgi:hypothetical protein
MLKFSPFLFVKDMTFRKIVQFCHLLTLKIMKYNCLFPFHTTSLHSASKSAPVNGSSGTYSIVYKLYVIPVEPISGKVCFTGKQADSEGQICSYRVFQSITVNFV